MRYLLLGIAIGLCAACGGKSHDSRFAGRWTGMVYDGSADPVDIQVRDSGAFDGTRAGLPTAGTIGNGTIFFDGGFSARFEMENGRIEGLYISLGRA